MNWNFWKSALMRCAHTVAQTMIAAIGTASLLSEINWQVVLSTSAVAGILSILKSIVVGLPEVDNSFCLFGPNEEE